MQVHEAAHAQVLQEEQVSHQASPWNADSSDQSPEPATNLLAATQPQAKGLYAMVSCWC